MIHDQPIFKDVSQALHVCYLIHSMPSTQKSPTQAVIERLVKENHVWDGVPTRSESSINFVGLTPMEIRAQCAQVVSIVNNMINPAESASIKASYGHQVIKADGVRYLADYFEPAMPPIEGRKIMGDSVALYIAWVCFASKRQREGITLAQIADKSGVSLSTIERTKKDFYKRAKALLDRGILTLEQRFIDGGLVPRENT